MRIALNINHDNPISDVLAEWRMADEAGVHMLAIPDSPARLVDLYVAATLATKSTTTCQIMTGMTNPLTRDVTVTAAALRGLNELAPGRIMMGVATGSGSAHGIGLTSASVDRLLRYILAVRGLLSKGSAQFEGRTLSALWFDETGPIHIPILVACSGPKVLDMASRVADGLVLAMGFDEASRQRIKAIIASACRASGRSPDELEIWWNSPVVFGDSVEQAQETSLGGNTAWMTMHTLEGKQIPEQYRAGLIKLNEGLNDLRRQYKSVDLGKELVVRAKELGVHEWVLSRRPGLFGTPDDIAGRLTDLEEQGMANWMFYVGGSGRSQIANVARICSELLPRLRKEEPLAAG